MDDLNPVTRTERLLDGEDLTPTNREEMFIRRIYDKTQEIPEPINRKEYFLKKAGEASGDVTVVPLNITENGTYSEQGKAYSPVTVEVEPPENSYQLKSITTPTSLATFNASAMPMPSLKVSVEAKQDLSHGAPSPNNICPISGWDEAKVSNVGKNLANQADFVQGGVNDQGEDTSSTIRLRSPLIEVNPSQTYALSVNTNLSIYEINNYDINGNWINYVSLGFTSGTYTPNNNVHYIKIIIRKTTNAEITVSELIAFQLETGTQATTYEPYINQTTTISLPQTVYGGEVDVVNGGGTGEYELVTFDGSSDEAWDGSTKIHGIVIPEKYRCNQIPIANEFVGTAPKSSAYFYDGEIALTPSFNAINVCMPYVQTTAEFKQWLSEHPLQVVFKLATPTTFATQPTPIKSLNGQNNLSVDTGDILEGEYFIALGGE